MGAETVVTTVGGPRMSEEQSLRGSRTGQSVADPVCLLTVGNTSSITQPTQSGPDPTWDQCFDFPASVTYHIPYHNNKAYDMIVFRIYRDIVLLL